MNVMGKLDRYIGRGFLAPFLLATMTIVGLYLVADAFSSLAEFLREAGSFSEAMSRIAKTYVLRVPTFIAPVLPIAMLVGAAYGVSQLTANNEITAMKASGLSFWRILTPIYALGVVIALLGFANRELLVPPVERIARPAMQEWTGHGEVYEQVVMLWESEQTLFSMRYNTTRRKARNVLIVKKLPDGSSERAVAAEAEPVPGGWLLKKALLKGETSLPETLWRSSMRPRDLETELLPADVRPIKVLRRMMAAIESDKELARGEKMSRLHPLLVEYYQRIAYPFAGIVLMALGIPFVVGHERIQRSRMLGIGVCVIIAMVFFAVQFFCAKLGQMALLPPPAAAFLPLIIFGGIGLYMLDAIHS